MITAEQAKAITNKNLKYLTTDFIFEKIEKRASEGLNRVAIQGEITAHQKKQLEEVGYLVEFSSDCVILTW